MKINLYCEFCRENHEFDAADVERLVYSLTAMVRDADELPSATESTTYCLADIRNHYSESKALYLAAVDARCGKRRSAEKTHA